MIQRSEFIVALGGAVPWPLAARAKQGDRVRRIGVLIVGSSVAASTGLQCFCNGLAKGLLGEAGWGIYGYGRKMTYSDLIHEYGVLFTLVSALLITPLFVLALRSLYPPSIEKRIKSQPDFTADDWLLSSNDSTGVAIDVGRKLLLLADNRGSRLYQTRDLIGCEVLLDDVQLSGSPRAAVILRISVNDVHQPQYDIVLLERSFLEKIGISRDDDLLTRQTLKIAQDWHERIMALIRGTEAPHQPSHV
jgi:hypothetical protein